MWTSISRGSHPSEVQGQLSSGQGVIRGKIVHGSVFRQFVRTVRTNEHELIRTN